MTLGKNYGKFTPAYYRNSNKHVHGGFQVYCKEICLAYNIGRKAQIDLNEKEVVSGSARRTICVTSLFFDFFQFAESQRRNLTVSDIFDNQHFTSPFTYIV